MRNVKVFGLLNGNTGNCSNAFHILKESYPTQTLMCEGWRVGQRHFLAFKASKHFPFYILFSQEATRKIHETRVYYRFTSINYGQLLVHWKKVKHPSFSILLFHCVPRKTPITWRESGGCRVVFRTTSRNQFQGMLIAHLPSTRL